MRSETETEAEKIANWVAEEFAEAEIAERRPDFAAYLMYGAMTDGQRRDVTWRKEAILLLLREPGGDE